MKIRPIPALAVLVFGPALLLLSGCLLAVAAVGAGIGYGAYEYVDGELESNLQASPPQVTAAAVGALKDLQLTVISSESSDIDGHVEGRTASDKSITIKIKSRSESDSHLGIRIGTFGDKDESIRILEAIKARLGIKPATPAAH